MGLKTCFFCRLRIRPLWDGNRIYVWQEKSAKCYLRGVGRIRKHFSSELRLRLDQEKVNMAIKLS